MEKATRRRFTSEQKASAVKRHLVDKEEVSVICEDMSIAPNQFYRWQAELFANATAAFEVKTRGSKKKSQKGALEQKVESLEARLRKKDNVIAEVTEECVRLKKGFGLG